MIRAALDTNVLASGFVRNHPQAPSVQLLEAWRDQRFEQVCSLEILSELERTLECRYFAARLSQEQIDRALTLLIDEATFTQTTAPVSSVATHLKEGSAPQAALPSSIPQRQAAGRRPRVEPLPYCSGDQSDGIRILLSCISRRPGTLGGGQAPALRASFRTRRRSSMLG